MAELVSLTASIVALLQISMSAVSYLNDVKDGPQEKKRLLLELSSVSGLLYTLKDQASRADAGEEYLDNIKCLDVPNGPLAQFKSALERLTTKLQPGVGWKRVGKALAWPFEREEIVDILGTIERSKTYFSLALQGDSLELSRATKSDIAAVSDKIEQLQSAQIGMYISLQ